MNKGFSNVIVSMSFLNIDAETCRVRFVWVPANCSPARMSCVLYVDQLRDLEIAASTAAAEHGAERPTAFPSLARVGGERLPVVRQHQIEARRLFLRVSERSLGDSDVMTDSMAACVVLALVVPPGSKRRSVSSVLRADAVP